MSDRSGVPAPRRKPAAHRNAPALTVWIYDSALGATAGEVRLRHLEARNALQVHDAMTISWMAGSHQPRIGRLRRESSAAAARGSVLGGFVSLIFFASAAGAPDSTGIAPLAERLRGTGIDTMFLEEMRASLHPGGSALLVLSGDADLDLVRPVVERGLARGDVVLMHAQMPHNASEILRHAVFELQGRADRI